MLLNIRILLAIVILLKLDGFSQSIQKDSIPWYHQSAQKSPYQGINLLQAYQFLQNTHRKPLTCIVAIIDSGIDTAHEDLLARLWRNPNEIPYNKIDDDHNGLVDDYYGWNFIGGTEGRNLDGETLESVRFYRQYKSSFAGKKRSQIPKSQQLDYDLWKKAEEEIITKINENTAYLASVENYLKRTLEYENIISKAIGTDSLSHAILQKYEPITEKLIEMKAFLMRNDSLNLTPTVMENIISGIQKELSKKYNIDYNPRPDIVKDNPDDINDTIYGNSNVSAAGISHGTGVSGIVAAIRNNGIGTAGIVDSVQIMSLRVVPGGDEYDKDVALAIRYAVNHGAKIINCSFGKAYSNHPEFVQEAIEYAIKHDVLIIHAAGNSASDNDITAHFPVPKNSQLSNWIEVGASNTKADDNLAASFTNYGKKSVDIFAPGVDIYSTSPKNNYRSSSGTSDAAPVVSGIAALIKSYYPSLSAQEIRTIILSSAKKFNNKKVLKPGPINKKISFANLCATGGVVDAFEAVKMADELANSKNK
jgi:subtilisin family serine protease